MFTNNGKAVDDCLWCSKNHISTYISTNAFIPVVGSLASLQSINCQDSYVCRTTSETKEMSKDFICGLQSMHDEGKSALVQRGNRLPGIYIDEGLRKLMARGRFAHSAQCAQNMMLCRPFCRFFT